MKRPELCCLTREIEFVADSPLPSEFLLFRAGDNPSTKGSVWFDDVSAEMILEEATRYANQYAIDLNHYMVRPRAIDPLSTDQDAMGYHDLAVRNGELWAVNVTWTSEGERRVRSRLQRYTSPAFITHTDDEGRDHVVAYMNVAICSRPATYDLQPLVATADVPTLDGRTESEYGRDRMSIPTPAPEAPKAETEETPMPVAVVAPEAEETEEDEAPAAPSPEEAELIALCPGATDVRSALVSLRTQVLAATGAPDLRSAFALASAALVTVRAADVAERRALVTELVAMQAETPATAWTNNAPTTRLAAEPLASLRDRVTALRAVKGITPEIKPPASGAGELTDFELRDAEKIKDLAARQRFIDSRLARKQKAL